MKRAVLFCFSVLISMQVSANTTHIIKEGDTLYNISRRYSVSVSKLQELNSIEDIGGLVIGSQLIISENTESLVDNNPEFYTVKKGDTLFSISRKFNLPLSLLMKYNNLKEGSVLALGQQLTLTSNEVHEPEIVVDDIPEVPEVEVVDSADVPYWPVDGSVTKYSGRIQGVMIEGRSGDYIKAVSNGKVIWYDSFKGIGKVVLIEGDNGYDYLYGTKEDLNVKLGVHITAGDKLGRLKESNTSIIFSVFKNGKPLSDLSDAPR